MSKSIKWDYNDFLELAQKCETKTDFRRASGIGYTKSLKMGWLDEFYGERKSFSKDECYEIAKNFDTIKELRENFPSLYAKIMRNKWDHEMLSHMIKLKNHGFWNFEKCLIEAQKYTTRREFRLKSKSCYQKCQVMGWLDFVCEHMPPVGNTHNRAIYIYEFPDKSVYVGLTCDIQRRNLEHNSKEASQVFRHKQKTGLQPTFTYGDYIPVREAQDLEDNTVEKYRTDGWTILNVASTGGLGGNNLVVWTEEKVLEESLKFNYRNEFREKSAGAFNAARRLGILDTCYKHMIKPKKVSKWTHDECERVSKLCKHRTEFNKKYVTAYKMSVANKWLDEFFPVIKKKVWDYSACEEVSKLCDGRKMFEKNYRTAYDVSRRNGWINDFFPKRKSSKK